MTADDRIQALVSGVVDRVRAQLQHEVADLVDDLRAHTAEERDEASRTARADAEEAAASLAASALAAERAAFDEQLRQQRADARAEALADARVAERQSELARAEQVLAGVRALDAAGSLSETLDALTTAAYAEAGRAAVFVVRGDELRGWAHAGFDEATPEARSLAWPLADAGLLVLAVTEARIVNTSAGGAPVPAPLAFNAPDRIAVAAPVIVDGRVVAVLYVDDVGDAAREVPSAWPEHVELLARHASRCLEALTARQAIRARAGAVVTDDATGTPGDDESAQRYARLLVSEIKLYHEPVVDEGRRARDLRLRLRPQIERARHLYEQRVPRGVRARADFFEQELVRTLADGDAGLLGHAL